MAESDGITVKQKAVMGGLIGNTDVLGKKVLGSYNPSRSYNTNLYHVKKCNSKQLEVCGTLLGLQVRSDDGKTKLYKNLEILADRIIMKIESLFEAKCTECSEMYQNTLDSTPTFQCRLCMLGSHDCDKMKEKAREMSGEGPGGVVWLCYECLGKNDLNNMLPAPEKKAKKKEEKEPEIPDESNEEEEEGEEDVPTEEAPPEEIDKKGGARVSAKRGKETKPGEGNTSTRSEERSREEPPICKNYLKRDCPHGYSGTKPVKGKTCDKRHPKRCYKFCDFGANNSKGCNKGKACEFWHPRICTASRKNEVCKKNNCTFQHLAHTREARESVSKTRTESKQPRETKREEKRATTATEKRDDKRDESSFLLKLIEEMRAGINEQLQEMRAEMRGCKGTQASMKIPAGAANSPGQFWVPPWYNQGYPKLSC